MFNERRKCLVGVRPKESPKEYEVFCAGCDYRKDYDSFRTKTGENI